MLGNRLQQIMDHYHLNPVNFSDKLQIQRSSLSHFFTGRNKPGWDFLEKMARTFPDINIQWLLTGSGEMLVKSDLVQSTPLPGQEMGFSDSSMDENKLPLEKGKKESSIEKVIVFYSNGTCKIYHPD